MGEDSREDELERRARELMERLGPMLPLNRARSFLDSACVHVRLEGIRLAEKEVGEDLIPRLVELLDDEAPFVYRYGERVMVAEVRSRALVALENLYRSGERPIDFGPVLVRKAMPADEVQAAAERALTSLDPERRDEVLERAQAFLDAQVQAFASETETVRAYRVLQELGLIDYEVQEVDPERYLTPLQKEIYAGQTPTPPAQSHLRIAAKERPSEILGYFFRDERPGGWGFASAEYPEAAKATEMIEWILGVEPGGIPRVVRDETGVARRNRDGSFVLDGTVPNDTDDPLAYLSSMAAFLEDHYSVEVVASGATDSALTSGRQANLGPL